MPTAHQVPSPDAVPRGLLWAAAALVLLTLAGTAAVRWSGMTIRTPDAPAQVVRALRFEDRPDGAVAVIDATTGRTVQMVEGQAGFVRGTLRGLARERKRSGFGPEQPFELIGRADGRLTLSDPVTGRLVDLESFGPSNAAVFASLLPAPNAAPAPTH